MTHDPICPQRECDACAWEGAGCCRGDCRCEEYAKVRADTLDILRATVREDVQKLMRIIVSDYPRFSARDGAQEALNTTLNAIEALRGES